MRFILGSASPRRKQLLAQIGVLPDITISPEIDETPKVREAPRDYCLRVTLAKLASIKCDTHDMVLCADTTVAVGRRILGKPKDEKEAAQFLLLLSGRRHQVITCVAVKKGDQHWTRVCASTVRMKRLSDTELNSYLNSDEWQGKAGGYAIQGAAAAFIPWISGSYSAIMGLPLAETASLLGSAGWPLWQSNSQIHDNADNGSARGSGLNSKLRSGSEKD